jgi:hypothetical protein
MPLSACRTADEDFVEPRHQAAPAQFAWGELTRDMRDSILGHTAASFAVESPYPIHLRFYDDRFSEVCWTEVPYVARYEFKLMPRKLLPRDLSTSPEIEFTLTRFLDPAFTQSPLFTESEPRTQEMLLKNFMFEQTFSKLSAVRLEMRSESVGMFQFVQNTHVQNTHIQNTRIQKEGSSKGAPGGEILFSTPFWSRVGRNTIEEVRGKLATMFRVELAS